MLLSTGAVPRTNGDTVSEEQKNEGDNDSDAENRYTSDHCCLGLRRWSRLLLWRGRSIWIEWERRCRVAGGICSRDES